MDYKKLLENLEKEVSFLKERFKFLKGELEKIKEGKNKDKTP